MMESRSEAHKVAEQGGEPVIGAVRSLAKSGRSLFDLSRRRDVFQEQLD
jgi:hypothetical protein